MKVLLTGGAGYIGSITTRTLLDAGHECVVLDTLERGWREAVDPRARLVVGSVGERAAVDDALAGCDAVIHMAGYIEVAESQLLPDVYLRVNAIEPTVLLDGMRSAGVHALVFSSTAAVYGEPERVPIVETDATVPVNAYGESKLEFEHRITEAAAWGLRAIRFRYFNVAGAMPDASLGEAHDPETHIIPRLLTALRSGADQLEIFGRDYPTADGTCVRDYLHVCDLADAHARGVAYLLDGGAGDVFNLGNGVGFSNLEVVEACRRVTERDAKVVFGPPRPGDPARLVASADRARTCLGWQPSRTTIEGIVEDAWRWHLAHPNGYR